MKIENRSNVTYNAVKPDNHGVAGRLTGFKVTVD